MDINIPKMAGYEATRKIHEQFPDTPVIVITAFIYAEDEQRISIMDLTDMQPNRFNPNNCKNKLSGC